MLEKLVYLCLSGYSAVILKTYLDVFFEKKKNLYRVAAWSPFFVWQFILNCHMTCFPAEVNLLLTMGSLALVVWLYYAGESWKKWVIGLLFLVLWMALEAVIEYGVAYMNLKAAGQLLLLSMLSKVLLHLLVLVIRRWINIHGEGRSTPGRSTWLVVLPVVSAVLYYAFYKTGQVAGTDRVAGLLMTGALLVIIIDLSVYPAYIRLMEEVREKKNCQYYIHQMEHYQMQMALEEQSAAELREMRHDLKQRLIYVRHMLEGGEREQVEEILTEMIGEVSHRGRLVCESGNGAVDAVVNGKAQEARERGGSLIADVKIPKAIGLTNTEIVVLLGNALDNALEALEYVEEGKRESWLEMKSEKGLLFIRLRNRYDGVVIRDEKGKIKSRKQERGHGIGYASMEKIVGKYHGEISVKESADIFTLEIFIYDVK